MEGLARKLTELVGEKNVVINADMAKYVTFKAGGTADYLVEPDSLEKLVSVINLLRTNNINYYVIGNGSNLLVADSGYKGVIIKIGNKISDVSVDGENITAYAGAFLSRLATLACENSLSGLEFAAGIPGFVGGAVAMNAGAYGGEFKDVINKVWLLDENGEIKCLSNEEMKFGYRSSIVQEKGYIVLKAELKLKKGEKDIISKEMNGHLEARREKQPLEYPSAGSTFKRPEGYFAGKLIMDAGLAGFSVGGASVSKKHCGFVINENNATATDIIDLMDKVNQIVYEKFQVRLEPEVKIIK